MNLFRKLCLYSLVGILAGLSSALLILSLQYVTEIRLAHVELVWFLPVAGFVSGWMYTRFGKNVSSGSSLIFEEIHDPKQALPLRFAPLVFINTILTHLFGGSAGREGTAVQMGASLADQLSKVFNLAKEDRPTLLRMGLSAAFGSALGAPWAGALFGMEVTKRGRLYYQKIWECIFASWVGYGVAHGILLWLHERPDYPSIEVVDYNVKTIFSVLVLGLMTGIWARLFSKMVHYLEYFLQSKFSLSWQMCVGGAVLVLFYSLFGQQYAGLGIPMIKQSMNESVSIQTPFLKTIATVVTVGSGFKGGEFVPLVFIGTGLGSALAGWLKVSGPLLASLGFGAVFAGAANVPLTCAVLLMEIFGSKIGIYALLVCYLSYFVSGRRSIYKGQK